MRLPARVPVVTAITHHKSTSSGFRSPISGAPGIVWVTALAMAWVMLGLVGHDPWKADEAHTFGIVVDFLKRGDWVVPTLAGEPFVEKPPLIYVVGGAFASLFHGVLAPHDAARLASGFFVGLSLAFLGLTARELYGRGFASATVLLLMGCFGTIARLHQLIPDVVLLAGIALGTLGLALARRTVWEAGVALGLGAGCAFLGKGLLGPGLLGLTALLLPAIPAWRSRRYVAVLGLAACIALIPAAVWMYALYSRSPALFYEWLVTNNFGRFMGFAHIGPRNPPGFYAYTLLWYAFPALPLAIYGVCAAWLRSATTTARQSLQLPVILALVVATVLGIASDSRELYLLPLMLPLSLLGAHGLIRLPARGSKVLTDGARWGLGSIALLLWLGWLALVSGTPAWLQSMLLDYQPGFEAKIHWLHLVLALAMTLTAGWVLAARRLSAGHALTQWVCGITVCWGLIATLWLPYLDAGKSYRTMIQSLVRQLPDVGCLASLHLGEPQRGLLVYFAQLETVRLELAPQAQCSALLVQGFRATGASSPSTDWTPVWEGARPGDHKELYRLYRRDVARGRPVTRFPE
jgi:4-amino-4-deoxy-L-arabinose transferase-like glycosyltransferase